VSHGIRGNRVKSISDEDSVFTVKTTFCLLKHFFTVALLLPTFWANGKFYQTLQLAHFGVSIAPVLVIGRCSDDDGHSSPLFAAGQEHYQESWDLGKQVRLPAFMYWLRCRVGHYMAVSIPVLSQWRR